MWDHAVEEILETTCLPFERSIASVGPDASASEVVLEKEQHLRPIAVLTDGKAGSHLPSHEQRRSWSNGDGETAFAVRVSRDVRGQILS